VVTGNMAQPLRNTLDAVAQPRVVIAVGDCACNRGVFADAIRIGWLIPLVGVRLSMDGGLFMAATGAVAVPVGIYAVGPIERLPDLVRRRSPPSMQWTV
jgi:Ni,Fe-hydrogenase III small subunit